ncbi:MAG: UDP-N-acetylmuramate dehydrogenase [Flavobacteriales bacterium]
MKITSNVELKPYNTFGLSSVAERLVQVSTKDDLAEYFDSSQPKPSLILGGGSNMLLTRDISGTVLKIELPGIEVVNQDADHIYVKVGAGEVWHQFVMHCISQGWAGVENLSLIPGNVGAAPMQNIGAYGVEIKSVFHELEAYLTQDKSWQSFSLEECNFGYRESVFKRQLKDKAVIASVTFKLNKKPSFNTSYGAINEELERMGVQDLSIKAVSDAVIVIRQSKLPDPKQIGNSGSFFKNPVIETDHFEKLKADYPDIVGYPASDGTKVAAGWLIEKSGFKGKRYGNYGVHDRQALVLVNYGGAKGSDVFQLSEEIISTIQGKFGITLEREVNII